MVILIAFDRQFGGFAIQRNETGTRILLGFVAITLIYSNEEKLFLDTGKYMDFLNSLQDHPVNFTVTFRPKNEIGLGKGWYVMDTCATTGAAAAACREIDRTTHEVKVHAHTEHVLDLVDMDNQDYLLFPNGQRARYRYMGETDEQVKERIIANDLARMEKDLGAVPVEGEL